MSLSDSLKKSNYPPKKTKKKTSTVVNKGKTKMSGKRKRKQRRRVTVETAMPSVKTGLSITQKNKYNNFFDSQHGEAEWDLNEIRNMPEEAFDIDDEDDLLRHETCHYDILLNEEKNKEYTGLVRDAFMQRRKKQLIKNTHNINKIKQISKAQIITNDNLNNSKQRGNKRINKDTNEHNASNDLLLKDPWALLIEENPQSLPLYVNFEDSIKFTLEYNDCEMFIINCALGYTLNDINKEHFQLRSLTNDDINSLHFNTIDKLDDYIRLNTGLKLNQKYNQVKTIDHRYFKSSPSSNTINKMPIDNNEYREGAMVYSCDQFKMIIFYCNATNLPPQLFLHEEEQQQQCQQGFILNSKYKDDTISTNSVATNNSNNIPFNYYFLISKRIYFT